MPLHGHLEVFNKIKPEIELGISIACFWVTNQSLRDRVFIRSPFISMTMCLILSLIHFAFNFDGNFNTNLVLVLIIFITSCQIFLKTLWLWYDRDNLLKLLNKAISLHNEHESMDVCAIAEKNLKKLNNIWIICFKITFAIVNTTAVLLATCNVLQGEEGVFITIPFVPREFPGHLEIKLSIQFVLLQFGCLSALYTDFVIVFFGIEIMAASDILFDYISFHKDVIQEHPDDLKIITVRFCELIENVKLFNDVISFSSFVQLVTSALMSFLVFFFTRLSPENPVGYFLGFCIVLQLFLPCLFGEFIKIRMERLSTTLYLTNWYDLKLKDQKSFLIVLGMIQREYGLKAAGLYNINIYTFIQIMKMAFSWCAFMFTLEAYC
uniref:Odorant receptor n=1 Tax=Phlebotomus papatasi TaxID=29031 RepID=A0A240SYM0_PHLPP